LYLPWPCPDLVPKKWEESLSRTEFLRGTTNRVYRIYKVLELNLRIKPRKQLLREKPEALTVPMEINQVWSMDFMHDQLQDGRSFRLFNLIDDFNREALAIEIVLSLPSARVIRVLQQLIAWRGKSIVIRCDNGPEYVSAQIQDWGKDWGIKIEYIQAGKPQRIWKYNHDRPNIALGGFTPQQRLAMVA
jgi:putative transposase